MSKHELQEGIDALMLWLEVNQITVNAFCRQHRLDQSNISKLLHGGKVFISAELAYRIHQATKGRVPWHLFVAKSVRDEVGR